jgi:hypothetical protein
LLAAALLLAAAQGAPAQQEQPHGDLSVPCADCHTVDAWAPLREPLSFEHDSSGFYLFGAHAAASCSDCHESLVFTQVPSACADCHDDAHRGELGFACESCHDAHTWENRRQLFDAHSRSLFPLFGTHATLDCESCHGGQQPYEFATTPTECAGCHLDDWQTAQNPNHVAGGFSLDCQGCHDPMARGWDEATLVHPVSFPLVGSHRAIECDDCHAAGFQGTPTDCYACHRQDYEGTSNPNHSAAGFPTDCEQCHDSASWQSTQGFDHSTTSFTLAGAHRPLDCDDCHSAGFQNTPTDCYACHRQDYEATDDPNHVAAGFPRDCEQCHNTASWETQAFDHSTSAFPLTGAHRPLDCDVCHSSGFRGTPTDCVSCHRNDYDNTRNPDHRAVGFSTDCESCHDTRDWQGANFDHDADFFPINSGKHRGRWADCNECHINPNDFSVFSCIDCHEHRRSEVDAEHEDVPGYSYNSSSCLRCHPDGDK